MSTNRDDVGKLKSIYDLTGDVGKLKPVDTTLRSEISCPRTTNQGEVEKLKLSDDENLWSKLTLPYLRPA
jgi:hypothetical protein